MKPIQAFKQYLLNLPGWRTGKKLVVIHSDDWGSIRTPSVAVRERLSGVPEIKNDSPYDFYDTLESPDDLNALYEVLLKHRDCEGRHPVITANCLMANPDFDKIRLSGFEKYAYESVKDTFCKYHNEASFGLWVDGLKEKIFVPQFHGREHVNVPLWMRALKMNITSVRKAFDLQSFGVSFEGLGLRKGSFQAAWEYTDSYGKSETLDIIEDGLRQFEKLLGYRSKTVIAPSYTWTIEQEKLCRSKGVQAMQGIFNQKIGARKGYKYKKRFFNQGYQLRNAFFEPSLNSENDLENVISRAKIVFSLGKPLIICSHRINFVGGLSEENRKKNLDLLSTLLKKLLEKWPDLQFISAPDLLSIIAENDSKQKA